MSGYHGSFNKKIFSMLIDRARADRTLRQFALACGISYVQMRKLYLCGQENPPRRALMEKLAKNSVGVELEDYLFAAGAFSADPDTDSSEQAKRTKYRSIEELFSKLTQSQQKTVYDFMNFLSNRT